MNETTILASTLSPEFIGMPTAPKAGEDADENQIANVGYVKDIIGETVSVDDDFSEESEHALQNKVITLKFESVDEAIADETLRATLAESALDTRIDEVIAGEAVFAPLDSPVFTGNPTGKKYAISSGGILAGLASLMPGSINGTPEPDNNAAESGTAY